LSLSLSCEEHSFLIKLGCGPGFGNVLAGRRMPQRGLWARGAFGGDWTLAALSGAWAEARRVIGPSANPREPAEDPLCLSARHVSARLILCSDQADKANEKSQSESKGLFSL